jgi:hypothetical protein
MELLARIVDALQIGGHHVDIVSGGGTGTVASHHGRQLPPAAVWMD